MADRYWIVGHSMGYVGTNSENEVDLCEYYNMTEDEIEKMSNEEVEKELADDEYTEACGRVDAWAKPK